MAQRDVAPGAAGDPRVAVGVDLGGTKIRAGLGSGDGTVLAELEVPTFDRGALAADQIRTLVEDLCALAGVGRHAVVGLGIGGAGSVSDGAGGLALAPNLSRLAGRDLVQDLGSALEFPVYLENDVNLAALGELGAGKVGRDFCFLALGTGVGLGIVLDGRLLRGRRGAAGEIAFLPFGADPLSSVVQRHGAFEEVVGGPSVARAYARRTGRSLTTPEVFDSRTTGDLDAVAVVDEFARWVAFGIAAVVAVLDPGGFVLGGGIGRRAELLPEITMWLGRLGHHDVPVQVTSLGPSGPILGGVHLAIERTQEGGTHR